MELKKLLSLLLLLPPPLSLLIVMVDNAAVVVESSLFESCDASTTWALGRLSLNLNVWTPVVWKEKCQNRVFPSKYASWWSISSKKKNFERAAWFAKHFFLPPAVNSSISSISSIKRPPNVSSISFAHFHTQPVHADMSVNSPWLIGAEEMKDYG